MTRAEFEEALVRQLGEQVGYSQMMQLAGSAAHLAGAFPRETNFTVTGDADDMAVLADNSTILFRYRRIVKPD